MFLLERKLASSNWRTAQPQSPYALLDMAMWSFRSKRYFKCRSLAWLGSRSIKCLSSSASMDAFEKSSSGPVAALLWVAVTSFALFGNFCELIIIPISWKKQTLEKCHSRWTDSRAPHTNSVSSGGEEKDLPGPWEESLSELTVENGKIYIILTALKKNALRCRCILTPVLILVLILDGCEHQTAANGILQ